MTQVFPFCPLPTPKLYANFLLVPIFVLNCPICFLYFPLLSKYTILHHCIHTPPLQRRRIFPYVSSYYRSTLNLMWTLLLFSCTYRCCLALRTIRTTRSFRLSLLFFGVVPGFANRRHFLVASCPFVDLTCGFPPVYPRFSICVPVHTSILHQRLYLAVVGGIALSFFLPESVSYRLDFDPGWLLCQVIDK
jgi:hypothetical protein